MRGTVEDLLTLLLGHTADHGEDFALACVLLKVLQAIENLLFGFIANGAGVVEDVVSLVGRCHL